MHLRGQFLHLTGKAGTRPAVEASFNGTMFLRLEHGLSDYISRKYLPEFKRYLGL